MGKFVMKTNEKGSRFVLKAGNGEYQIPHGHALFKRQQHGKSLPVRRHHLPGPVGLPRRIAVPVPRKIGRFKG